MFSIQRNTNNPDESFNNKNTLLELYSLAGKGNFKEIYEADILKFKQEYLKR